MNNTLLSTGQVSGATEIPDSTMRRYIRELPEFFSDDAKRDTKGRRYTERDIDFMLAIRGYCNRGLSFEEIRKEFENKKFDPQRPSRRDVADAVRVVANANNLLDQARRFQNKCEIELSQVTNERKQDNFWFMEADKKLQDLDKKFNQLWNTSYPDNNQRAAGIIFVVCLVLAVGCTVMDWSIPALWLTGISLFAGAAEKYYQYT